MTQNKIPWCTILSVVCINDLPITLALIMPYHWYGIISRNLVMINADSFLIWNNCVSTMILLISGWYLVKIIPQCVDEN